MSLSTVSATIQDPSGQAFANGTWQLVFKPTFSVPGVFTDNGATFTTIYGGNLDATGSFSQANVNRNDTIAPAGSRWTLTVTPNANSQAFSVDLNINNGAFSATASINAVITNVICAATIVAHAYKDTEVIPNPSSGGLYFNTLRKTLRAFDVTNSTWLEFMSTGQVTVVTPASPGVDMGDKIQQAINAFPSGSTNSGGVIDATAFTGDQTWASTLTVGVLNQAIGIRFGLVRIISSANPIVKVPVGVSCNILGAGNIAGLSSPTAGGTQIVNNGATNDAFDWFGSSGNMQNLAVISSGAGVGLFVKALASSGRSALGNTFTNLSFIGPGTGVAGSIGIQLQSNSASELSTENTFTAIAINQFENAVKLTTTLTQGPTDNWFNGVFILGGGPGGTGYNIQAGDINWITAGIIASCATGVLIGATATQNVFATRLETNTTNVNNAGIGTMFLPANMDANTITDTGTNTVILGAAQVGILQKLGNGGGFQMNAPVSIGQPPQTGTALFIQPIQTLTGGTQTGMQVVPQTSSSATGTGIGIRSRADTMAAAFTQALNQNFRADTPSVGAGSSITEWNGFFIDLAPVAGTKFAIKSNALAPAQFADYVQSKRLKANQGTTYTAADTAIVLSAGWGTTRTVSAATGFDQALSFNVNATGTGQAASPTIVITFKDGTWTAIPQVVVLRNDIVTPFNTPPHTISITATTLTITFNGTPTAGNVYSYIVMCMGV